MAGDRPDALRRLYVTAIPAEGALANLDDDTRRHARVLRLGEGDRVRLFDGRGGEATAVLEAEGARILERATRPEGPTLVLVQALPKGRKADDIVRMATELGATAVHFATTERSVPRLDRDRATQRLARWRKVAREAARQSERATVPEVLAPAPLDEVVARAPAEATKLVAWARGGEAREAGEETWVAVGPEGGFSDAELAKLDAAGWARLRLARHVLRVETAAAAALAILGRPCPPRGEP